jgi:hypothetical protein
LFAVNHFSTKKQVNMLKKTQTLVIALAVFALFAACQKDELSPVNEDPEVPELPQDPVIPKWEKIDGIPEGNFVSLAVINGQVLALDNQNLYRINPENWSFSKKSFENPNFPNVTKTPISKEFFAAIKGSEIVVFSSLFPKAKGKIDVNEFLEGDYSIIAAYSHAPKTLQSARKTDSFLFLLAMTPETLTFSIWYLSKHKWHRSTGWNSGMCKLINWMICFLWGITT